MVVSVMSVMLTLVTYLPLDDFGRCPVAGFGPTCRYGDYSASKFFNDRLCFVIEDVHALTNVAAGAQWTWATRLWPVPLVMSAG